MNIPELDVFLDSTHLLPAIGTWRESYHVFDERSAQAIRAAMASGRPLLVRGEPGTGKSQLARAAAKVLGRRFLSQVIDAHTEIQDLWFRFDAVSRLGNAQVLSVSGQGKNVDQELDPEHYLSPGILWWAFAWGSAAKRPCKQPLFKPGEQCEQLKGTVLLLDEVDKADADLPNSLLETLDNGRFTVPWINETVGVDPEKPQDRPLVILTTNEDRQLPAAFVRRCLVLDLSLPTSDKGLRRYLRERAAIHFPLQPFDKTQNAQAIKRNKQGQMLAQSRFSKKVLIEVADQMLKEREEALTLGFTPPGQAEYLDMLRVLDELVSGDEERQLQLLLTIRDFALKKYPGMQQAASAEFAHDTGDDDTEQLANDAQAS